MPAPGSHVPRSTSRRRSPPYPTRPPGRRRMPADTPAPPMGAAPVNVLLVDDVPANLLALEAVLGGPDRHLVRAASGEDALRLLAADEFAVVVLDLQMPGLDGYATAARLRADDRTRHTPVIFVTAGDPDAFPLAKAYALGAVDYLAKPLVPEVIRAKVDTFVHVARQAARIRDLERRQAEAALKASEDRFRLIVESATDYAIFTTDPAGRIQTWSQGAARVFGYAPDEVVGRRLDLLFPPEAVAKGVPDQELAAARRDGRAEDEGWLVRKDGTRFWAGGRLFPLGNGTPEGFLKVLRDDSRARAADEAKQAEARRKDEFLATLTHELRNLLAPVRNGLQVLRLAGSDPDRERACGMMDRQVHHLARLLDDLTDVSRIGQGKVVLRKERVDLRGVLAEAAEASRPLVDAGRHTLAVHRPPHAVPVEGDRTRLTQVFANLLNNAAKYTEPGGRIEVDVGADGGQAVVRVRDTGVGIPPELLPTVFELFAQVGTSLDRSQGGLGIGLALVRRLVELHGGSVGADSAGPGRGSTFTVRLPLAAPGPAGSDLARPVAASPAAPVRPRRVLVVDDHPDVADSLALLLRLDGHEVRVAGDGATALGVAAEFQPEVVFLDLGMPGMNGYETARRLREEVGLGGAAVVALTGWGTEADRRRTLDAGFAYHLVKPPDPAEVAALLATLSPAA